MGCRWIRKQLNAYQSGQLPAEDADRVRRHLSQCAGCGDEARTLAGLTELLRSWTVPTAPEDLDQRILAAIRSETLNSGWFSSTQGIRRRPLSLIRLGALSAACCLLFAAAGVSTWWIGQPATIVRASLPQSHTSSAQLADAAAAGMSSSGATFEESLDWVDRMIMRSERDLAHRGVAGVLPGSSAPAANRRVVHLLDLSNSEVKLVSHLDLDSY